MRTERKFHQSHRSNIEIFCKNRNQVEQAVKKVPVSYGHFAMRRQKPENPLKRIKKNHVFLRT
jgi:hypothetical protein